MITKIGGKVGLGKLIINYQIMYFNLKNGYFQTLWYWSLELRFEAPKEFEFTVEPGETVQVGQNIGKINK